MPLVFYATMIAVMAHLGTAQVQNEQCDQGHCDEQSQECFGMSLLRRHTMTIGHIKSGAQRHATMIGYNKSGVQRQTMMMDHNNGNREAKETVLLQVHRGSRGNTSKL